MVEVTNTEVSEAKIPITLLILRRCALFTVDVSLIKRPLLLAIKDNMHSSEFREETDLHLCIYVRNKFRTRRPDTIIRLQLWDLCCCLGSTDVLMRKVQCSVFTDHMKGSKKFPLVIVFCVCLCFRLVLTQQHQHQELVGVEWPVKDSTATTFSRFNLVLALLP